MTQALSLHHRSCGVLMHLTSLPGGYGIGDLGASARRFADFLVEAGQTWWQMLPVHPVGPGDSPYSSPSAFAGNPLLIDLDVLIAEGMLSRKELPRVSPAGTTKTRYATVIHERENLLRLAFKRYQNKHRKHASVENFDYENRHWLDDYALYRALKKAHNQASWITWDTGTRSRQSTVLNEARRALRDEINYQRFIQYQFFRQWQKFKYYCNSKGVGLIGDMPIFVDLDSCDVWTHRDLFRVDTKGRMRVVSGAPPDAFIATGQKWGHPLYRWSKHEATGFTWWIDRLRHMLTLFDAVRVDHFLGFHRCWAIPGDAPTAESGRWSASPGQVLFTAATEALGPLPVIVEDLGVVVPAALELRDRFGFLGMRILQNAFGENGQYDRPHHYTRRCVAYTGTHDNDTTVGWFKSLPRGDRRQSIGSRRGRHHSVGQGVGSDLTTQQRVLRYTGTDGRQIHWDFVRLLYMSVANLTIVPMQDFIGLDSRSRMNIPGTPNGNWHWRLPGDAVSTELPDQLYDMVQTYGRLPNDRQSVALRRTHESFIEW